MDLRDQSQPSVIHYYELFDKLKFAPGAITYLSDSVPDETIFKLKTLESVKDVVTLERFVAENQQEKLSLIPKIHALLNQGPAKTKTLETIQLREKALIRISNKIATLENATPELIHLKKAIDAFILNMDSKPDVLKSLHYHALSHSTLLGLSYHFNSINSAKRSTPFTLDDLPQSLVERYKSDIFERVEIFPAHNMRNNENQKLFVDEVLDVIPKATGLPVIHQKAGKSVVNAFMQAFSIALVVITLLLCLLMRDL